MNNPQLAFHHDCPYLAYYNHLLEDCLSADGNLSYLLNEARTAKDWLTEHCHPVISQYAIHEYNNVAQIVIGNLEVR